MEHMSQNDDEMRTFSRNLQRRRIAIGKLWLMLLLLRLLWQRQLQSGVAFADWGSHSVCPSWSSGHNECGIVAGLKLSAVDSRGMSTC